MADINVTGNRKPVLGFVILSHLQSPQLARLVSTLNRMYGNPPIVIHHDLWQTALPLAMNELGANVWVVRRPYRTKWAHISVQDAFQTSLQILFDRYAPDWFSLISAACYPVARAEDVLNELANAPYDAFLDHWKVVANPPAGVDDIPGKRRWIVECYHRYVSDVRTREAPFSGNLECYAGSLWFTANAKAAEILIASRREQNFLFYYYTGAFCPEESLHHTVLCNRRELRICNNSRRYADWSRGGYHPADIEDRHLDAVLKSGAHFARKFSAGKSGKVLDALDRVHFADGAPAKELG